MNATSLSGIRHDLGANASNHDAARHFHSTLTNQPANQTLILRLTTNPLRQEDMLDDCLDSVVSGVVEESLRDLERSGDEDGNRKAFLMNFSRRSHEMAPVIRRVLEDAVDAGNSQIKHKADKSFVLRPGEALTLAMNAVKAEIARRLDNPAVDVVAAMTAPSFDPFVYIGALDHFRNSIAAKSSDVAQTEHNDRNAKETLSALVSKSSNEDLEAFFRSAVANFAFVSAAFSMAGTRGMLSAGADTVLMKVGAETPEGIQIRNRSEGLNQLGDISFNTFESVIGALKERGLLAQPDPDKYVYLFKGQTIDFDALGRSESFEKDDRMVLALVRKVAVDGKSMARALQDLRDERI